MPPAKRLTATDRRAHILEAARRVFLRSGFAGARIKAISEEAGINEALLYRHFASKEELYEAAMGEPLLRAVERLLALGDVADERMVLDARGYAIELVEEMLEAVMEISLVLGVGLFGEQDRAMSFYRKHFAPAVEQLSERLAAYWEARGNPGAPARLVVEILLGTALLVSLDERLGIGGNKRHDLVVQHLADALLRMVEPST